MKELTIIAKKQEHDLIEEKIIDIFKVLENARGVQVFLHGSWTDNTTTAFSDIDDFVIVDDTILSGDELSEIEKLLKHIENQFYKLDPLQHHGHWKVYKSELSNYNNSYLPLFILENSICLSGEPLIETKINHYYSYYSLIGRIKNTLKNINLFHTAYQNNELNIYNLKRFVGSIALLTPLLFQLQGNNLDKRTAINQARKLFSPQVIPLIKWATDLRQNWHLLLNTVDFKNFVNYQETIQLDRWQNFAENNAPCIPSRHCSNILLTQELVDCFIEEAMEIMDSCIIQKKTVEDYQKTYQIVENFAIQNNALMVGHFGEIKHAGISDLDVFICFPDEQYKELENRLNEFIQSNNEFAFFFTHPTVCVSEAMLPYLPFLHTLSNLNLTYNKTNYNLKQTHITNSYTSQLNLLWTLLIIPLAQNALSDIRFRQSRELLLRLKNIHTSIDNISKERGLANNEIEKSNSLRQLIMQNVKSNRHQVIKEFSSSYHKLIELINYDATTQKKYFILGRKLILLSGKYEQLKYKDITILSFPEPYYNILKNYYKGLDSNVEILQYLNAYHKVNEICDKLQVQNPLTFLLTHYTRTPKPTTIKKLAFNVLEKLPLPLLIKII